MTSAAQATDQRALIREAAFSELLRAGTPLLDLRAPQEFARGALPGSTNLPLLDDAERHRVGLCYKQAGHAAAVALGHRLVSGEVRAERMAAWCAWADAHPEGVIYCWRGGQRSEIVQQWLAEAGRPRPRIEGGYKALRRHLLGVLEHRAGTLPLLVLGGRTGAGKTRILEQFGRSLDLEGLARHRGSAFGARVEPQPPPAGFENALAVRLLELTTTSGRPVIVEDESRNIGRLSLPDTLTGNMAAAPLVMVDTDIEERVRITLEDYIVKGLEEHTARHGEAGFDHFAAWLRDALYRIRKRLGGERHRRLTTILEAALAEQARSGAPDAHRTWIRHLLADYYDPMYDYQLRNRRERIVFRGTAREVTAWLAERVG